MTSTPANDIAPIPGNPSVIRARARTFTRMAEAIQEARAMMQAVIRDATEHDSEAVDALASSVGNARERLADLKSRYEVAGSELSTFADVLEEQQTYADEAVAARDSGVTHRNYYQRQYEQALHEAQHGQIEQREEAARQVGRYRTLRDQASQAVATAGAKHFNALAAVKAAGDRAANAIAQAVASDGVNDSLWDRVTGAMKDWVSANAGWLTTLKNILGGLTAIVGLLSIAFPVLAPIALGLAGATALLSFTLAAAGEGSWLDFGLDMVGVLTFGVGAVFARGVGLALRGTRIARGLNYNRQLHSFGQRVLRPIATRREAIRQVTQEFQRVLPNGQRLITQMPRTTLRETFTRSWLELSGRQVAQYRTILDQAQLGANGVRAQLIDGLGQVAVSAYRGTQAAGTAQDVGALGLLTLGHFGPQLEEADIPVLSPLASGWNDVQTATTAPLGTSWHAGGR